MTDPIRAALERAASELELSAIVLRQSDFQSFAERAQNEAHAARAALAQPEPPAEALAARPLLEQVARMGDRIGQQTVGEIMAISDRAAAWLRENPPGQPVAIEPRGCPTPGACSCVVPVPSAEGEVGELVAKLRRLASQNPLGTADPNITRAADLLEQRHPAPVPVSERLPGPELCWWYEPDEDDGYGGSWTLLRIRGGMSIYTNWLPAHALPLPTTALPLPAGEVQQ